MAKTPLEDFFDLKVKITLFQKDSYILLSEFIETRFDISMNSVGKNHVIYIQSRNQTVITYTVGSKKYQSACKELLLKISILLKKIFYNKNFQLLEKYFLNPRSEYSKIFQFENPEKMQAIASQLQQKTA